MGIIGAMNSVGSAYSRGMTMATGGRSIHQESLDGASKASELKFFNKAFRGVGAIGVLGAAGAAIGASATLASDGTINPLAGAAVGGAIGAAALPVAGFTTGAIGNSVLGLGKSASAALPEVATGLGSAAAFTGAVGLTMGRHAVGASWALGKNLVKMKKVNERLADVSFTKTGKAALGASSLFAGVRGAFEGIKKEKMGTYVGMQGMTPTVPHYQQTDSGYEQPMGGATGDLVFALNDLRHG